MRPSSPTGTEVLRRWLGAGGLLAVTVAATVMAGLTGLLVSGILAVIWYRLTPEYAFALGQFALGALVIQSVSLTLSPELDTWLLFLGEIGLIALLVAPSADATRPPAGVAMAATASVIALAEAVTWLGVQRMDSIWLPVVGLTSIGLVISYSIQQYEHWQLGYPPEESLPDYE